MKAVSPHYFFLKFLKAPTEKNVILSGVFLGLAQLAKFSAVLLFPLFIVLLIFKIISSKTKIGGKKVGLEARFFTYLIGFVLSIVVAYVLVGIVYGLTMYAMPVEKIEQLITASLPGENVSFFRNLLLSIHDLPVLKYYTQYLLGLFMVFKNVYKSLYDLNRFAS